MLTHARHRSADRDHGGVHEAYARREHLADVAAGLAYGLDRVDVAALYEVDDLVAIVGGDPLRGQRTRDGGARGEGFGASSVTAVAGHVGAAGNLHVPDVARDPLRSEEHTLNSRH